MVKNIRWVRLLGASVLLYGLAGCGIFESVTKEPKQARLSIDQVDAPSVEVSTSIDFIVVQGNRFSFEDLVVDTITADINRTYDIKDNLRIYVLAKNIHAETISFRMKIWIDDKSWYNEVKTLTEGEIAQFVYRYQAPIIY